MKKRVAFCLRDMQLGGVESVLIQTLNALIQDKNFDLTVVTYVDVSEPRFIDWFRKHSSVKRIVLYPSKYFGTKMPRFFLSRLIKHFCRDIYRFVRRIFIARKLSGFDTVIDYHDFGFVREFRKVSGPKKIAWFHSGLNVFIKRRFINYVKYYDNIVVLTDDCANELKQIYPSYTDKFVRIYNPLDIKNIQKNAKAKCPVDGEYFCSVARMSYDKDIKTMLNAFDLFWQKHKTVKMVLVGGGDKLDVFKNYANGLKSGKNILFMGAQKNPFVYMKNALANVLSSYGEGFALVLIESQAIGTVNIASNCKCGPREILLDGDAGLLFEQGDVNALAAYMADVYDKKVDIKKMIRIATRELKRFDQDTILMQVKSLIS